MKQNTDADDVNMMKVECAQGHSYHINTDVIEPHAGRDAYECPDCEHMVDAMKASRRAGWS